MELKYFGKRGEHEIYDAIEMPALGGRKRHINGNVLFQSDNLSALKYLIEECDMAGRVDLVYIDPPFATNADFTFSESRSSTISRASGGNLAYSDKLKGADFLEFLRERLLLIRRLMSKRGSIYLHIDYKIGHYVKVLMDEVFGIENFKNDITRIKCNPKNFHRSAFGNIKDMILFYGLGSDTIWNDPREGYTDAESLRRFPKVDSTGRRYMNSP